MKVERTTINGIPATIWGEDKRSVYLAIHGNMSNREDEVIRRFAELVTQGSYQVISIDLPEHGERKEDSSYPCTPENCINDIKKVLNHLKVECLNVSLWACSMGAYFSMLAMKDEEDIEESIFLSPVVDMKYIIDGMMKAANVTEEELKEKREIETEYGPKLSWDYYEYVKNNPIESWPSITYVLYGSEDNMQPRDIIDTFCNDNNAILTVLDGGEHFFHTEEQLEFYDDWLKDIIWG